MKLFNGDTFVNDEKVIGKWEFFCNINSLSEFNVNCEKQKLDKGYKEIYFMPNGEGYWVFEGWSKGYMIIHLGGDDPILKYKYSIKEINGESYLFLEIKNEDEEFIEVLKKVSSKEFKVSDFKIKENINLPFINDEYVIGNWQSVGFVENIDDFSLNENYEDYLWLKSINFKENGEVIRKYFNDKTNWEDKWTKGYLIDQVKEVVSNYIIKNINGEDYMFIEWKMGNYIYGGLKPWYYVLKKEK